MINVSTIGDNGCKIKLCQSPVTDTVQSEAVQGQHTEDQSKTSKPNGDISSSDSICKISKNSSPSSSHLDENCETPASSSCLKVKSKCRRTSSLVGEEVVDLSSDVDEEDVAAKRNMVREDKSDSSSGDVFIVEDESQGDKVRQKTDSQPEQSEKDNQDKLHVSENSELFGKVSEGSDDRNLMEAVNDENNSIKKIHHLDGEHEEIKNTSDNCNASSSTSFDKRPSPIIEQISDEESEAEQAMVIVNCEGSSPSRNATVQDDPIANENPIEEEDVENQEGSSNKNQEETTAKDQVANDVLMEDGEIEEDREMETVSGNSSTVGGGGDANETQPEGDNFETITGDRSFSEESVLQNPDVTFCTLSNSSGEKLSDPVDPLSQSGDGEKDDQVTNVEKSEMPKKKSIHEIDKETSEEEDTGRKKTLPTLIPRPVSEINERAVAATNEKDITEDGRKEDAENQIRKTKKLKVLYPKKRFPSSELEMVPVAPALRDCLQCAKFTTCSTKVTISGMDCFLCSKECIKEQKMLHEKVIAVGSVMLPSESDANKDTPSSATGGNTAAVHSVDDEDNEKHLARSCASCNKDIILDQIGEGDLDSGVLQWATLEFCTEECLAKFQSLKGSHCQLCDAEVSPMSMGKYSVRFGYETRQFCTATCLEEFKKGLKVCSYCQRDLNADGEESAGFLAPVGDKGQFKDFCSQDCLEKYDSMSHNVAVQLTAHECAVCNKLKIVRLEVLTADKIVKLCSYVCFAAYKFVNDKMKISLCDMCKKYFDVTAFPEEVMFYVNKPMVFCSKTCLNVQVLSKRKICPCNWCKVKKYNFDMIRKKMNNMVVYMCSLNCLALYQVSLRATIGKQRLKCDWCSKTAKANFHLTMSDASLRNFCSFECVDKFRGQYKLTGVSVGSMVSTPPLIVGPGGVVSATTTNNNSILGTPLQTTNISTVGQPQRVAKNITVSVLPKKTPIVTTSPNIELPVISSIHSFHNYDNGANRGHLKILSKPSNEIVVPTQQQSQAQQPSVVATQAPVLAQDTLSLANYQPPQPQIVPEIIIRPKSPVAVRNKMTSVKPHCFAKGVTCRPNCMRTTRSAQTVSDENEEDGSVKNHLIPIPVPIYVPTPLAMYSLPVPTLVPVPIPVPIPVFIPTTSSSAKNILEDIERIKARFPQDPIQAELLTMAEAAAEDVNRSSAQANGTTDDQERLSDVNDEVSKESSNSNDRGNKLDSSSRKRAAESPPREADVKRKKAGSQEEIDSSERSIISSNKSNSNTMSLKYSLGVNAWRYLANRINKSPEEYEVQNGKDKVLQSDLLKMRHDELNQALTLLMKEGKKPDGESYSPDTKYYLALGIQYYLLINGRVDNIFFDPVYESFTDHLDKEADLFQEKLMNSTITGSDIVTRVQEEHLWESRQLGVHSPYVLLSTLMYLNTKQFNLSKLEDHMQLSFSDIRKDCKRGNKCKTISMSSSSINDEEGGTLNDECDGNESTSGTLSNRSLLLRFYPPQAMLDGDPKREKMFEQFENKEDPSRCPVRLYEFYLSRCPESVKSRSDVFYLLPERSCAPDSPVWYSSIPLPESIVKKWLNRIKMVKEINVALVDTKQ